MDKCSIGQRELYTIDFVNGMKADAPLAVLFYSPMIIIESVHTQSTTVARRGVM